ncbi:sugar transferase [Kallotenue papyrolyticum]|uniref:sugar transferase n=1 Tax=Kallotenue papyrolyticum TaxID=1325125 RepID=UPI00047856F4|nr:sugar transferase [Kallotenue papyrolyticum]
MALQSAQLGQSVVPRVRAARLNAWQRLIAALVMIDVLIFIASLTAAYWVRFASDLSIFDAGSARFEFYRWLMLAMILLWLGAFAAGGLYSRRTLFGGVDEYNRVFHACNTVVMLVMAASFIEPDLVVARGWLLMTWGLTVVGAISARFALRRWVYRQRRHGRFLDRTLIVGANPEGLAVAEQLISTPSAGTQILGFVDDFEPRGAEPVAGVPVLGSSATFEHLVRSLCIDQVIIANSALTRERLLGIYGALDTLNDVEVRLASGLFELLTTGVRVREEGCVPLVSLNKTRIVGADWLIKTTFDKATAALALLLLALPLGALALLIKLDSPGPVFYRRRVVGQHNRPFDAFKLRTMYVDGDSRLTVAQRHELAKHGKLVNDPRVTAVGRWLRRYSLDELPQLLNVLRGEMSLIGPRMLTEPELEKFGRWRYNLRTVKPGLTGLWQISGRSDLSYEDRIRLDMFYIRNYSIWLDLRILLQTPLRVLRGDGAY